MASASTVCRNFVQGARSLTSITAYGPGIVDTPMWEHIDRELAQIVSLSLHPRVSVINDPIDV